MSITYHFEYPRKLKIGYIGTGGHSYRNILPTFQYAPVDLVAFCDLQQERALAFAKQFGATRVYTSHHEMLQQEELDAVFIVTSYHPDGRVQATDLALQCLRAGVHVWMEKPVAASLTEVDQLIAASRESSKFLMVGLKKIFFPAIEKVMELISSPAFGQPASLYIRYPQALPAYPERADLTKMTGFLDHIFHPASVIQYLMGNIARMSYEREPVNGGTVTNMRFASGAVGTMHLTAGQGAGSPLERLEVVGQGASVTVDNGVKLTYYRPQQGEGLGYGRSSTYLVNNESAPLYWEPEFSLGQLYNKNIFMLGYAQEVIHFCESVLQGTPPARGTLAQCREIMKLFEVYRNTAEGTIVHLD